MTNRKRRLKKGISSLETQIEIHKEKKKQAEIYGKEELVEYYDKEIKAKQRDKEKKEEMLRKQKG